jgi:hypothetical protein
MRILTVKGALYSGDDFIMMPDTQLVVSETTNDIFNNSLYSQLKPTGTVITWLRSMVASRMATTAPEWTAIFARFNSGMQFYFYHFGLNSFK